MEAAGISYTGLVVTLTLVSVAYLVISPVIDGWGKPPLPPGPPALPIIGNVHQMSLSAPWKQHMEWTKQYGPIFRLKAGKDTMIVLGTMQAARDLLDKKSKIYSSRPRSVMAFENVSKGLRPVLMPDNEQWKTARRLQGVVLTYKMSQSYRGVQALESLQLLRGLLQNKGKFQKEFHRYSTSTLFALAYGQRMTRGDEEEVKAIDLIVERFALFGRVGTWIVDAIPVLNYLPTFLAPWKRIAEECHAFESKMHMKHLHQAIERPGWNFVKAVKDVKAAQGVSEKELAYIVAILLEAGAETTTNALETFVLAARLFPRIIGPAQAELESVVGTSRLPTVDDSPNLPYINAIVKETLRWRPVVPESVPHLNTEEDEYMGYRIPKGSIILPNVWGIHLNPDIYPDPNNFLPERWLATEAEGEPPEHAAFGFGRRICTGQHIAYNSLFLNVARILWACNIGPKIDADGHEVPVDEWGFSDGFISRPLPFEVSITPRSEKRTKMVEKAWDEADKDLVSLMEKRPM